MQFFFVFILFILLINLYLNFLPVLIVLKIFFIEKILTCITEDMLVVGDRLTPPQEVKLWF